MWFCLLRGNVVLPVSNVVLLMFDHDWLRSSCEKSRMAYVSWAMWFCPHVVRYPREGFKKRSIASVR